jgi:hypothetical protein
VEKVMDYKQAVDKDMPFVMRVREKVFPTITEDQVKAVHDSDNPETENDHYIEFGGYLLVPVKGTAKRIGGEREVLKWAVTALREIPGSFNPFDGGTPPDVDECDLGEFSSIVEALSEIGRQDVLQHIDSVGEEMMYEQMAADEEAARQYEAEMANQPQLCPHGREFHECNSCLEASDRAYDAMRERQAFGRR